MQKGTIGIFPLLSIDQTLFEAPVLSRNLQHLRFGDDVDWEYLDDGPLKLAITVYYFRDMKG